MPLCNHWILYDNSSGTLSVVAESSENGTTVRDPELFGRIKSVNEEYEKELKEQSKKIDD